MKRYFEADVLGELFVARNLHRQNVGGRLNDEIGDAELDLAGGQARVHRAGLAGDDLAGDGDDAFRAHRIGRGEGGRAGGKHALRDAVMIAQVDEQQTAVIALGMHPAREAGGLPGIGGAQRATGMGAIGVHRGLSRLIEGRQTSPSPSGKSSQHNAVCHDSGAKCTSAECLARPAPDSRRPR